MILFCLSNTCYSLPIFNVLEDDKIQITVQTSTQSLVSAVYISDSEACRQLQWLKADKQVISFIWYQWCFKSFQIKNHNVWEWEWECPILSPGFQI